MQVKFILFGGPRLLEEDTWIPPTAKQSLWLYSYLAYQEDWVSRDELLSLFWPELSEARARQNLRSLLYKSKKEPYGDSLELDGQHLRCQLSTDVSALQEAISRGQWQTAIMLYRGPFLARYQGRESSAFEAWLEQTRDELHAAWRDAVLHLAESKETEPAQSIKLLQEVLKYDFLAEDVVQACMKALAEDGQKAAALNTFATFRLKLNEELELEPLMATLELAEAIRTDSLHIHQEQPLTELTQPLPQLLSPFIGRTLELLELKELISNPLYQLISLLGPGGMGKTRLALQVAYEQAQMFPDGTAFVPLAAVRRVDDVPDAIASALGLELSGEGSVATEVLTYLNTKELLLVLDNFEHLLGAAPFVKQLLKQAPNCKLLVTSRVLLGIANEVIYDVKGLTIPASPTDDDIEAYDAVQLFLRTARRIRSDFRCKSTDYPVLFKICQTLDGMPLALELAANWVRLLSLPELLHEILQDIDLLESTGQEVSERHQSLRKVFEYSWQRLSFEEQRSLAALSVFQGGFHREAANLVTELSAKILLRLVNKSLLKATASGRFFVLEVIRQYADEKLEEKTTYQQAHSRYYLDFLLTQTQSFAGPSLGLALGRLEQDLENIRLAWQWALENEDVDLCTPIIEPLKIFLMAKARAQEGIAFFNQALQSRLIHDSAFHASVHHELSYFYRRSDQYPEAKYHAEQALSILKDHPLDKLNIKCLCELAHILIRIGKFSKGLAYAAKALDLAKELGDAELITRCKSRLALAKTYLGHFEEARLLYHEVLTHQRMHQQNIALLRTFSDLGRLLIDMGQPREAESLFQEGLELAQTQHLPYELGFMWEGLSLCSYLLGDFDKAKQQAELALAKSEAVNDSIGIAVQCTNLAKIALALNQDIQAQWYLQRALKISWQRRETPEILKTLLVWASILTSRTPKLAAELLSKVVAHPAAEFVHKQEARASLSKLKPPIQIQPRALATIVQDLLIEP